MASSSEYPTGALAMPSFTRAFPSRSSCGCPSSSYLDHMRNSRYSSRLHGQMAIDENITTPDSPSSTSNALHGADESIAGSMTRRQSKRSQACANSTPRSSYPESVSSATGARGQASVDEVVTGQANEHDTASAAMPTLENEQRPREPFEESFVRNEQRPQSHGHQQTSELHDGFATSEEYYVKAYTEMGESIAESQLNFEKRAAIMSDLDDFLTIPEDRLCTTPIKPKSDYPVLVKEQPAERTFRDHMTQAPWQPLAVFDYQVFRANLQHMDRCYSASADNATAGPVHLPMMADPGTAELSWRRAIMADRLIPQFKRHIREWNRRAARLKEIESDRELTAETSTAHDDHRPDSADTARSREIPDDSAHGAPAILERPLSPVRRVTRLRAHCQDESKAPAPVGNDSALRKKVFDFTQRLREDMKNRPMPRDIDSGLDKLARTPESNKEVLVHPYRDDKELKLVQKHGLEELQPIFEEPDLPIGMFCGNEADYWFCHRERRQKAQEQRMKIEQGEAEGDLDEFFSKPVWGRTEAGMEEQFKQVEKQMIDRRKILPEWVPVKRTRKATKKSIAPRKSSEVALAAPKETMKGRADPEEAVPARPRKMLILKVRQPPKRKLDDDTEPGVELRRSKREQKGVGKERYCGMTWSRDETLQGRL